MEERFEELTNIIETRDMDIIPAMQLSIIQSGKKVFSFQSGSISTDEQDIALNPFSLFDITSLTKVFTAVTIIKLIDMRKIQLDDAVCSVLEDFQGYRAVQDFEDKNAPESLMDVSMGNHDPVDASKTTIRQLLADTSGLPGWRPLYTFPSRIDARNTILHSFFSYQPNTDRIPSDIGYLLLGWIAEQISFSDLYSTMNKLIFSALELEQTGFRPNNPKNHVPLPMPQDGIAPLQGEGLFGESSDNNSLFFHGITGHSGLFSTADELSSFGTIFLTNSSFIKRQNLDEIHRPQGKELKSGRSCGFACEFGHINADGSDSFLNKDTFGHSTETGTMLWVDPQQGISAAMTANGKTSYANKGIIQSFQSAVLRCIFSGTRS